MRNGEQNMDKRKTRTKGKQKDKHGDWGKSGNIFFRKGEKEKKPTGRRANGPNGPPQNIKKKTISRILKYIYIHLFVYMYEIIIIMNPIK